MERFRLKNNLDPAPKQTVTVRMVFVFLGGILAMFVLFLVYLRYSNFSPLADYYTKKEQSKIPTLSSYLTIKLDNHLAGETVTLKIVDTQLAEVIGISNPTFPLKKAKLSIDDAGVHITGKTSNSIFGLNVEVLLVPKAQNKKLIFLIQDIKAGGVTAPSKVAYSVTPLISSAFEKVLPVGYNLNVSAARTIPQYLVIDVEK